MAFGSRVLGTYVSPPRLAGRVSLKLTPGDGTQVRHGDVCNAAGLSARHPHGCVRCRPGIGAQHACARAECLFTLRAWCFVVPTQLLNEVINKVLKYSLREDRPHGTAFRCRLRQP